MSTEAKHTPGPWRWVDMMHHGYVILDSNNDIIATDIYACAPVDIELMCAAPEMLQALKQAVDALDTMTTTENGMIESSIYDAIVNAKAAIAKAEGRGQA
jgi:hypothetical protein